MTRRHSSCPTPVVAHLSPYAQVPVLRKKAQGWRSRETLPRLLPPLLPAEDAAPRRLLPPSPALLLSPDATAGGPSPPSSLPLPSSLLRASLPGCTACCWTLLLAADRRSPSAVLFAGHFVAGTSWLLPARASSCWLCWLRGLAWLRGLGAAPAAAATSAADCESGTPAQPVLPALALLLDPARGMGGRGMPPESVGVSGGEAMGPAAAK
jgi:hypothetical protein